MSEQSADQHLLPEAAASQAAVECLGMTFESDAARRAYFLAKLREGLEELHTKLGGVPFTTVEDAVTRLSSIEMWPMGDEARLRDMAERMRHGPPGKDLLQRWKDEIGFPHGAIEDILRLSDPPYYTACPNPFMADFIKRYGKPYDPDRDDYHREPFAADVSEGKTDPLYNAHAYYTKVPHKAIMRYILHYTEPGDIVLDGFAGSGMTGVAAQMCAHPDPAFKRTVEAEWSAQGKPPPKWGARRVVLNDLGPAATFIAANYNLPFDLDAFKREARRILAELEQELGWMYETVHTDGRTKARINYTVWSEVFACPECGGEILFLEEALDQETKVVRDTFPCPHCSIELTKTRLHRLYHTIMDPELGCPVQHTQRRPVLINYSIGKARYEKHPDQTDLKLLQKIEELGFLEGFPTDRMMHAPEDIECWGDNWRAGTANFAYIHHLFLPRPARCLALLWSLSGQLRDTRLRNMLLFFIEQAIWGLSILNRYAPSHFSQVNRYMSGLIRILSQHAECSPWYILKGKLDRLVKAFRNTYTHDSYAMVSTGTASDLIFPDNSLDYIFTDPPFGDNLAYAELNFIVETFHCVFTNSKLEAIISTTQKKRLIEYQTLMHRCFAEYHRVLKPGRWMTVVFHNSRNSVWNAIQEAMLASGFVVADVRTLDKQQGSYNQVVTAGAVKQDLIISAYKPNGGLEERFRIEAGTEQGVWDFVKAHLRQLPVFAQSKDGRAEVIAERMNYLLFDRMVAFHVQRHVTVPLSASEFYAGLTQRFPERDGMYFLPEQVVEYDRKRMTVKELLQLELAPSDESSAIQWLRQQLARKPQTFQELHPQFLKAIAGWLKHEKLLELSDILDENFLRYDGRGSIPEPIWSWMQKSATLRERMKGQNRESADPTLRGHAKDRWYVPDPNKAQDLERLRERNLLREFDEYKAFKGRQLKVFRLEAVRAGFKKTWAERDYHTILDVASKIPEHILQEDPKLLMWYDQALTRTGGESFS
ncbi:MAG TPA: DNA methyltransferase [Alphaproteobacteria bacterium]|nr:DNA methyltransferase [Alphaproteobacteria bacterium]